MISPIQLLFLMAAFLVPNSQAVISDRLEANMQTAGYYCQKRRDIAIVSIHYQNSTNDLPCSVSIQKNSSPVVSLLEAKRNKDNCESKAKTMMQRLVDRGWRCLSSGL
ncbi:MAG: putative ATP-grasp superfamily ATP-dependent carboligase [Cellvibrionaceae bacterium]|jgi:predicted ATP-grasp superfamily ATP-dependent carboligase